MFTERELRPAELDLWRSVVNEKSCAEKPRVKRDKPPDNEIRAEVIQELALGRSSRPMLGSPIITLEDKTVVGDLELEACHLVCRLQFARCTIGSINLDQAEIPDLVLINCTVKQVTANQLSTRTIFLSGTTITDGFDLVDANLSGVLNLEKAHLGSKLYPDGSRRALNAHNLVVDGDLLASGLDTDGMVDISGARIGGYLVLSAAHLSGGGGAALSGSCLYVRQDMRCGGLNTRGAVLLKGAQIEGCLELAGTRIKASSNEEDGSPARAARAEHESGLAADFLSVGREMRCGGNPDGTGAERPFGTGAERPFQVEGPISLSSAQIQGRLDISNVHFTDLVNLESASVHVLNDHGTSWPGPGSISLRNFTYGSFADIDDSESVKDRLAWLTKDADFSPQIYNALADAYRADGQDQAVRKVLMAKLHARSLARRAKLKKENSSSGPKRFAIAVMDRLLWATVGYGYRPLRIMWWFLGMVLFGWLLFTRFYPIGAKVPASHFYAHLYTLDLLLPLADLGHRAGFTAVGAALAWTTIFTLLGWLFGLTLVAGISGVFKRD